MKLIIYDPIQKVFMDFQPTDTKVYIIQITQLSMIEFYLFILILLIYLSSCETYILSTKTDLTRSTAYGSTPKSIANAKKLFALQKRHVRNHSKGTFSVSFESPANYSYGTKPSRFLFYIVEIVLDGFWLMFFNSSIIIF